MAFIPTPIMTIILLNMTSIPHTQRVSHLLTLNMASILTLNMASTPALNMTFISSLSTWFSSAHTQNDFDPLT